MLVRLHKYIFLCLCLLYTFILNYPLKIRLRVFFFCCYLSSYLKVSMDEIKCLIVSDGVKNVSIFDTLHVLVCQVRSRRRTAAAWKQPVSASSPLPVSCVPLFPPESQLQTCCPETPPASGNIQPRGGELPVKPKSPVTPTIPRANARKMHISSFF